MLSMKQWLISKLAHKGLFKIYLNTQYTIKILSIAILVKMKDITN